jgi:hypothetical protein
VDEVVRVTGAAAEAERPVADTVARETVAPLVEGKVVPKAVAREEAEVDREVVEAIVVVGVVGVDAAA